MINYIDLFCGIGGFRQGIEKACGDIGESARCLFACDNDYYAAKVYEKTYKEAALFDIKKDETHDLIDERISELKKGEELDFILAGFPCQSFSKAGNQEGFNDVEKGNLFYEIIRIADRHKPRYMLLENVRNLKSHDGGYTWEEINKQLKNIGYIVDHVVISPNQIPNRKIPALRDRVFIICYREDVLPEGKKFFNDKKMDRAKTSIYIIVDRGVNS